LASVTIVCVTFGIVGLGVGMGAMFPRFKFENVTQIAGSTGGLLYMIATTSFIAVILFLEAFPVYFYFSFQFRGEPEGSIVVIITLLTLVAVITLNMAAVFIPMRLGRKRLAAMEF
jgi:ABC-2 type transport system permease protein